MGGGGGEGGSRFNLKLVCQKGTPAATTTTAAAAAAATTTTTTTAPREHVEATVLDKAKRSNEACQAGEFRAAIDMYTEAIALDLNNHVLISNRSAAFVHIKKYQEALSDADKVVELKPDWAKVREKGGGPPLGEKRR